MRKNALNPFSESKKMKYENIWNAVDKLAEKHGLSPSGLAKRAGLDATTFNKSKRLRPDGKQRWPSLDSINRLLEIFGLSFEQFYALSSDEEEKESSSIPFIKLSQLFELNQSNAEDLPMQSWAKILFPEFRESLYAIEIDCNEFAPIYRFGTTMIVAQNSDIRKADRILIFTKDNRVLIKEFVRRTPSKLVVTDVYNPADDEENILISDIVRLNRIVWISQ